MDSAFARVVVNGHPRSIPATFAERGEMARASARETAEMAADTIAFRFLAPARRMNCAHRRLTLRQSRVGYCVLRNNHRKPDGLGVESGFAPKNQIRACSGRRS